MRRVLVVASAALLVASAAALAASARGTFVNTEPLAAKQWYLTQDQAWNFWPSQPTLAPVKVAVIDSGIDAGHPEFAGKIVAGKSFVPNEPWNKDTNGHGTFVAGIIAASNDNNQGIAGIAFNAKLLIGQVVDTSDSVYSIQAEYNAIVWAVNHGARVINLSIGALRDPEDLELDGYSALERKAVEYAYSKGVLVVAAAGNSTEAPKTPWTFADYPAALPHVLGVAGLDEDGQVNQYSDHVATFVDVAAPGAGIVSTVPRNLTATSIPGCDGEAYSDSTCAPPEFRLGVGTSFAAPQVTAEAALLLGVDPKLTVDQLEWLIERSATDETPGTGCTECLLGRDSLTGWGRIDIDRALTWLQDGKPLPTPDAYEPNDDAGTGVAGAHPLGNLTSLNATLDYWDDPVDVYSFSLRKGEQLFARLSGTESRAIGLILWSPKTQHVDSLERTLDGLVSESGLVGTQQRLTYRAKTAGRYYLEVKYGRIPKTKAVAVYHLSVAHSEVS